MNTAQLVEMTVWESATAEAGVIRDVKILGQRSKNRRLYTEDAMANGVPLYEGKAVYVSHSPVVHRPAPERFGRLTNVRYDRKRKELRGDLTFLESQKQMCDMLKEDLDRRLNFFGLSHVADGLWHRDEQGNQVVTKIEKVTSVDLVSDPATATSLREQADATAEPAPAPAPAETPATPVAPVAAPAPLVEQTAQADAIAKLTEQVTALTAQVAALSKPRKYTTAPAGTPAALAEQTAGATDTDAPPKDKAALRKWLLTK